MKNLFTKNKAILFLTLTLLLSLFINFAQALHNQITKAHHSLNIQTACRLTTELQQYMHKENKLPPTDPDIAIQDDTIFYLLSTTEEPNQIIYHYSISTHGQIDITINKQTQQIQFKALNFKD
ncbi:hypothetical protein JD969_12175 [Planctomycetota bacterium]|nr:hypothetical protein JD969_12175 [Planctomycetota bacterium]